MLALYVWFNSLLTSLRKSEKGQDLVEYVLLLGFIALAVTLILVAVRGDLRTIWTNVSNALASAATTAVEAQ